MSILSPSVRSLPHLFYFVPVPMSWSDAQTYCRQHYTDLVTINELTDVADVLKTVPKDTGGNIWIGLYRTSGSAPWIWSDQSNSTYRSWGPGQPNNYGGQQFCTATTISGSWNDIECAAKFTSICYSVRKRQIVRVEVKSSQTVNGLDVNAKVLETIKQKLKEVGMAEDATVSWNMSGEDVFHRMWYQKNEVSKKLCQKNNN
ncbi:C-type lectin BfL-2-like [Xyrauchen texanus]|uniref:C-type lectin BfL-2-like n=1 Tax=Xyrauchen texanus TaxID=154827 RepID=UPI002241921F|nr:C-type lectin BfL-2-like [Xyrauchen texanus]